MIRFSPHSLNRLLTHLILFCRVLLFSGQSAIVMVNRDKKFKSRVNVLRKKAHLLRIECNALVAFIAYSPEIFWVETHAFPNMDHVLDVVSYEVKNLELSLLERFIKALTAVIYDVTRKNGKITIFSCLFEWDHSCNKGRAYVTCSLGFQNILIIFCSWRKNLVFCFVYLTYQIFTFYVDCRIFMLKTTTQVFIWGYLS